MKALTPPPHTPSLHPTPTVWLFDNSSGSAGMCAEQRAAHIKARKHSTVVVQSSGVSTPPSVCVVQSRFVNLLLVVTSGFLLLPTHM